MGALASAAESPYTSLQEREIKAISQEQIEGLQTGQGMGFALAAELNGYPGPKHVLELRDDLNLTADQLRRVEAVFAEMKTSAEQLGRQIVDRERELDRHFASHAIDAETLSEQVARIAELEGRLRGAHLQAHLEMVEVLSQHQITRYIELRGYEGGEHSRHHPVEGHGVDP